LVELFDAPNPLWGLLEQALSNVSHHSLVFSDLCGNSYEGAELWREVNILPFLTDFKQGLFD